MCENAVEISLGHSSMTHSTRRLRARGRHARVLDCKPSALSLVIRGWVVAGSSGRHAWYPSLQLSAAIGAPMAPGLGWGSTQLSPALRTLVPLSLQDGKHTAQRSSIVLISVDFAVVFKVPRASGSSHGIGVYVHQGKTQSTSRQASWRREERRRMLYSRGHHHQRQLEACASGPGGELRSIMSRHLRKTLSPSSARASSIRVTQSST